MNKKILCSILCFMIISMTGCSTETDKVEETSPVTQDKEVEETKEVEVESRGIKGSHYINPRMGLEERGFPEKELDDLDEMNCQIYDNMTVDQSTGIQYSCGLTIENDHTIISAEFGTLNLNGLDTDAYTSNATRYLKYCGSLPYDEADIDKVYEWIDENIGTVGGGDEGANIVIGDAEFNLYGTQLPSGLPGARMLSIQKVNK